ncbi:DUF4917 family protein [Microbulbifer halophilus]|uniref:DUF4917 family protein n=1 Tax=Microbulbifer halophilus TaxID=453963 RepID=A0ABW5EJJ9_9GAMM|nr:DUF4917 family protein [Microbulbifer halophilus]MCW8127889.1 DUF4917 family protein [Microbulbifer halophilus]
MDEIVSFDDAISDSARFSKRHLLLGNGFSIACRADIFHYASLFGQADFSAIPEAKRVFDSLNTQDFEEAIKALENSAKIIPIYTQNEIEGGNKMAAHATALKDLLVTTIAGAHPASPNDIDENKFWSCRRFLNYFIGSEAHNGGYVFTLNYDLLLYWTLMNEGNPFAEDQIKLKKNDSFGNDEDLPESDYVVWQGETAAHSANIFFLHGALHLFDSGSELQKYTWIRSGERLVDQARRAISENKYPLFVAEGTSTQKKNKIRHNAYLYQGFKVLTANAQKSTHCFFIFGHSLAENDDHILTRLARGRFRKLYVGIFGDPDNTVNKTIIQRAKNLATIRHTRYPLEVAFFDSETARVWDG